jgi:hypothetical protein
MRYKIVYLLFTIFASTSFAREQDTNINSKGKILEKLFGQLANSPEDIDRIRINDSIISIIEDYTRSDSVLIHKFNNLRYLGQITSPDSLLKIVTWNLILKDSPGRYFCYFIKKHEPGNKIFKLTAAYSEFPARSDTVYTESDWYGALYYDIRPYKTNDGIFWTILGIDYGNPLISRKLIDVVSFTPGDSVIFGKKWFAPGERIKFRDVFEYASGGTMSLRFSSDSSIVFDHLVPFSPAFRDDHKYYGPDYSFDAYLYKNGIWKLKINVDARNRD